jgi:hypothetical protein
MALGLTMISEVCAFSAALLEDFSNFNPHL